MVMLIFIDFLLSSYKDMNLFRIFPLFYIRHFAILKKWASIHIYLCLRMKVIFLTLRPDPL